MEAFDLSVGLRSIGTGPFGGDAELGARVAPGVGPVGGAVVGQDSLNRDVAVGEPRRRASQHADGGGSLLIGVDLGVGDAGVVVEHRVYERGADARAAVPASVPGALRGRGAVSLALLPTDVAPATAVGDVAELGDVDVDQRARMRVLVATQRDRKS